MTNVLEISKAIRESEWPYCINRERTGCSRNKNAIRKIFIDGVENGAEIGFIEVRADESLIRERLKKTREYSEADFDVYKKIKKEWEPLNERHLILHSTDDNISGMLQQAINYLHLKNDKEPN